MCSTTSGPLPPRPRRSPRGRRFSPTTVSPATAKRAMARAWQAPPISPTRNSWPTKTRPSSLKRSPRASRDGHARLGRSLHRGRDLVTGQLCLDLCLRVCPTAARPAEPTAGRTEPTAASRRQALPARDAFGCAGQGGLCGQLRGLPRRGGRWLGLAGAADFTDLEFMRGEKPAEFFEAIRDGVEGTAMPAWGETLSEMDIWDVLYYEWAFATSPEEMAQGQATVCRRTVSPVTARQAMAPAWQARPTLPTRNSWPTKTPPSSLKRSPRASKGSAMPAWGEAFSEDEIWSLVNYVWTFAYEYPEREAEPSPTSRDPPPPTASALPAEPDPAVGQQVWAQKAVHRLPRGPGRGRHRPQAGRDALLSSTRCCSGCGPARRPCPPLARRRSAIWRSNTSMPGSSPWPHPRPRRRRPPACRCPPRAT